MEKLTKEFSFDPPPVKKKKVDAQGCLIHCRDIDAEVTQLTSKSWEKVSKCGQLLNDDIFHSLSKLKQQSDDISPEGGYHRQCYQRYTNKTLIEKAFKKVENRNCNSLPNLSGVSCNESTR